MEDPKTKKDLDELEVKIDQFVAEYDKSESKTLVARAAQLMASIQIRKEENYLETKEAVLRGHLPSEIFYPHLKTLVLIGERHYRLERKILDTVGKRIGDILAEVERYKKESLKN